MADSGMSRSVPFSFPDSTENRLRSAAHTSCRLRFQRIFRPVVFRIAAAHVLANIGIGASPETSEVARYLYGTLRGRKELERHGDATISDTGRGIKAKDLLEPHRDRRSALIEVVDTDL